MNDLHFLIRNCSARKLGNFKMSVHMFHRTKTAFPNLDMSWHIMIRTTRIHTQHIWKGYIRETCCLIRDLSNYALRKSNLVFFSVPDNVIFIWFLRQLKIMLSWSSVVIVVSLILTVFATDHSVGDTIKWIPEQRQAVHLLTNWGC